jgi:TonB family protein
MRNGWIAVAMLLSLPAAALAHEVTAPQIIEEPHGEWPNGHADEHDVVVPVEISIGPDGTPTDVDVEVPVSPAFDAAALVTARKFRFKPATADGKPVASRVRAVVRFAGQEHAEEHAHGVPHHHDDIEHDNPHQQIEHELEHELEHEHQEIRVQGDKPGTEAASRVHISGAELELRPRLRPGDILEAAPGLFAVQHAGGGKANQFFLRGFDADHGTDVAFFVDGVPVNMVSHGHGQGFSDFHFLIPELVVALDAYKGPYYANLGNFATAGAVDLHLAETFDESRAQFSVGQYGVLRGLVLESPKLGEDWRAVVAAEVYRDNGPFANPEDLTRFNLYGRVTHDLSERSKVSLTWMSYGSKWNGSGQIPARAVCGEGETANPPPSAFGQPCIDRFGNIDPTEGGDTQRHMASLDFSTRWKDSELAATVYAMKYDFTLFSNFTFFKDDPLHGDEIEQDDNRVHAGGNIRFKHTAKWNGLELRSSIGSQVRIDSISNALHHDQARVRLEDKVAASIAESAIALYGEEDVRLTKHLRFIAGARADRMDVNVDGKVGTDSGVQGATRFSPKLMAVVSPTKWLDVFADYGRGFHSNDARGVVRQVDPATLMTPATGWEAGVRVTPYKDLVFNAAAFLLDLDSELVWSGDEGTTEVSGKTRRYGLEVGARWHLKNWLFADADATFTHAEYRVNAGDGQAVALAPRVTFTAGLGAQKQFGDFTPFAAMRVKAIGNRPANQDESLTADGFCTVDANAGLRWKNIELAVDAQNLFDSKWREVSFATTSRLPYELGPVSGIHYSPGWPLTVIGRATVYWK